MNMFKNLKDVYEILVKDEILLRLLYYPSEDFDDSPLSDDKPNILNKSTTEKWDIINELIKTTNKTSDLTEESRCRICVYMGNRRETRNNAVANQQVVFDIYAPIDWDEISFRLTQICDTIDKLFCGQRITGLGKTDSHIGGVIVAPSGFIGYRLIYDFGSAKS
ncbi:MAG: hypothetical protein M0R03_22640 [Novosphingobium sp.]|nr:hypothetical protein [Novosphingobium sp.]